MIRGGNATIFVADMNRSIDFYTKVLGLRLRMRAENFWAEVQAGSDLVIGLHPASKNAKPPGTEGSIQIGLTVTMPLEEVRKRLAKHGVKFHGEIIADGPGRFVELRDPDGTRLYFWEMSAAAGGSDPGIAEAS